MLQLSAAPQNARSLDRHVVHSALAATEAEGLKSMTSGNYAQGVAGLA